MQVESSETHSFRPRARLLVLLGDQLIGSSRLALFELVKNAYDADAAKVRVILKNLNSAVAEIVVRDDGIGMTFEDIRDIWLVPGADHKLIAKSNLKRSDKGRLPLGEKGLGRFAVHKLGEKITLVSRKKGQNYETKVHIDWAELASKQFLSDTQVKIVKRPLKTFLNDAHGTRIQIRQLRETDWTRGEVRRVFRQITSICSPFDGPKDFVVELEVPDREDDLKGIPSYQDILDRSLWRFKFEINEEGLFSWAYEFSNALKGVPLESRKNAASDTRLLVADQQRDLLGDSTVKRETKVLVDKSYLAGVGRVRGEFYVFDRDKEVLARLPESQLIRLFLDESGGIRVYRDGMRVYNYGEKGDDWLGLDLRRVNVPAMRISRNIIVGAIQIEQEASSGLREKTNREGFVDDPSLDRFKKVVLGALSVLEIERKFDKDRLRILLNKDAPDPKFSISAPVFQLRQLAADNGVLEKLDPTIRKIEAEFENLQETMLRTGFSGLGLAVVFHEVERGVRALRDGLQSKSPIENLVEQAVSLTKLFDGFAGLLKRNEKTKVSAKALVKQARDLCLLRFKFHGVRLVCPLLEDSSKDFELDVSHSLVLGILNNLLDNAFYWLRVKYPEIDGKPPINKRSIFIDGVVLADGSKALIVADNGPGFVDPPNSLVQPFLTRKPDGMGLGLYYANLVMELSGGRLVFSDTDDFEVPAEFNGANIALIFGGKNEK